MDLLQRWGTLDVLKTQSSYRSLQDMRLLQMIPVNITEKAGLVTVEERGCAMFYMKQRSLW